MHLVGFTIEIGMEGYVRAHLLLSSEGHIGTEQIGGRSAPDPVTT